MKPCAKRKEEFNRRGARRLYVLIIFSANTELMKACLLLLLLPFVSTAQDTCGLKKSKDPFTNVTKLSTGFKKFDGNGVTVSISADATPSEIDFFVWVKNEGKCFDPESEAQIVYEGEKARATIKNSGSMNCDGAFHFTFKNNATTTSVLKRLGTKRLSTIKLISGKIETLITLTEEQKASFLKMAQCIAAEGLTLRAK